MERFAREGDSTVFESLMRRHGPMVRGLLFASEGRSLASSSNDGTILIW